MNGKMHSILTTHWRQCTSNVLCVPSMAEAIVWHDWMEGVVKILRTLCEDLN